MLKFVANIEKEYWKYKKKMLEKSQEEVWDRCCEIYFYSSFYEYFLYNEAIPYVVAEKLENCNDIIAGCWELYLKHEELSILSWEDMGEIIAKYIERIEEKEKRT